MMKFWRARQTKVSKRKGGNNNQGIIDKNNNENRKNERSNAPSIEWILDVLVRVMRSPRWEAEIWSFIDEHCLVFSSLSLSDSNEEENENELCYTTIHLEYQELMERVLYELVFTTTNGITEEEFVEAVSFLSPALLEILAINHDGDNDDDFSLVPKNHNHEIICDQILAIDDFLIFKKLMTNRNHELEKEVMITDMNRQKEKTALSLKEKALMKKDCYEIRINDNQEKCDYSCDGAKDEDKNYDEKRNEKVSLVEEEETDLLSSESRNNIDENNDGEVEIRSTLTDDENEKSVENNLKMEESTKAENLSPVLLSSTLDLSSIDNINGDFSNSVNVVSPPLPPPLEKRSNNENKKKKKQILSKRNTINDSTLLSSDNDNIIPSEGGGEKESNPGSDVLSPERAKDKAAILREKHVEFRQKLFHEEQNKIKKEQISMIASIDSKEARGDDSTKIIYKDELLKQRQAHFRRQHTLIMKRRKSDALVDS